MVTSHLGCSFCADRERDDLISALVSVRSSLAEVQQRETSAYKQVKHAVQMTEEANFEKTKASLTMEVDVIHSHCCSLCISWIIFITKLIPNTQNRCQSTNVDVSELNKLAIWRIIIPLQISLSYHYSEIVERYGKVLNLVD